MFVVRRSFRGPKGVMSAGSIVELADLKDFKYHLQQKHIVEVNEQNFDRYQNFFKEKSGIDLPALKLTAAEDAAKADADAKDAAKAEADAKDAAKAEADAKAAEDAAKADADAKDAAKAEADAKAAEDAAKAEADAKAAEDAAKADADAKAAEVKATTVKVVPKAN